MTSLMNMKRLLFSTLFMLSAIVSFAQQVFTASGVVVDETGETIIGATVQVVGDSKLITATDMDGKFTLANIKPGAKLEVSYVGMKTFTGPAKPTMKITMINDNSALDEVVVTAFGEQKRSLLQALLPLLTLKRLNISRSIT